MSDAAGRPMHVALCDWLDVALSARDRMVQCLLDAIEEAMLQVNGRRMQGEPIGTVLLLNLPAARPGMPGVAQSAVQAVHARLPGCFSDVRVAELGHAGSLLALQSAAGLLAGDPRLLCLVAGAESFIEPDTLEWLETDGRVHGAGDLNNAWGFVPGEGAAAVLLTHAQRAKDLGLTVHGRVVGIGSARESLIAGSDGVCLGRGLTHAFQAALESLEAGRAVSDVYCDMNGEPYRADEFAFAVCRTRERFLSASEFIAPADCWGDVGAASGVLLVSLACWKAQKLSSKGECAMAWCSSDQGERAAALIETGGW